MTTTVKMVIMSHLSDLQESQGHSGGDNARINFCKYLLMKHPNTEKKIDADKEFEEFLKKNG
jgi:hypothetical protein